MTQHSRPRHSAQVFGAVVPARNSERDVLGTVLSLIWGFGSLIAVGCLAYLPQHSDMTGTMAGSRVTSTDEPSLTL